MGKHWSAQQTLEEIEHPLMVFQIMDLFEHVHFFQYPQVLGFRLDTGGSEVGYPFLGRVSVVEEPVTRRDLEQPPPQAQHQTALEEPLEEQVAGAIQALFQAVSVIKHIARIEKRYLR